MNYEFVYTYNIKQYIRNRSTAKMYITHRTSVKGFMNQSAMTAKWLWVMLVWAAQQPYFPFSSFYYSIILGIPDHTQLFTRGGHGRELSAELKSQHTCRLRHHWTSFFFSAIDIGLWMMEQQPQGHWEELVGIGSDRQKGRSPCP